MFSFTRHGFREMLIGTVVLLVVAWVAGFFCLVARTHIHPDPDLAFRVFPRS